MSDKPKLSICIPTYNRAGYLRELLDSIVSQLNDDNRNLVEIAISDNASTDNTSEVIEEYKNKVKIVYNKNPENLGPDKNYLKSAEIATGEFCIFFGSDDAFSEGSIDYILTQLDKDYEIYITERLTCDLDLKNPVVHHYTKIPRKKDLFDFKKDEDLIEYFSLLNTLAGVFSFLSSIIFKKSCWDKVKYNDKYTGTAYSHVFVLLNFIYQEKCRLYYLDKPIPLNRQGNDSFLVSNNWVKRHLLDFKGYKMLAEDLFSDRPEIQKAFLGILTREIPYKHVLSKPVISNTTTKAEWENWCKMVEYYPYTKIQAKMIKYFNIWGRFYYIFLFFYKLLTHTKPIPNLKNIFRKNICYFVE